MSAPKRPPGLIQRYREELQARHYARRTVAAVLRFGSGRGDQIPVWGTVQEGRVLPVRRAPGSSGISKLGPVLDQPTLASLNRAEAAAHGHEHGDVCTLAQWLAKAAAGGLINQHSKPSLTSKLASQTPKP